MADTVVPVPMSASRDEAVLDAIRHPTAVLDHNCIVVAVNAAWRRFGSDNIGGDVVGSDYLAVCDRAGDTAAAHVARGIRAVLAGAADPTAVEYGCHGPRQRRFFRATVSACSHPQWRALVVHENITGLRLAEAAAIAARESTRAEWTGIFDAVGSPLLLLSEGWCCTATPPRCRCCASMEGPWAVLCRRSTSFWRSATFCTDKNRHLPPRPSTPTKG